MAFGKRTVPPSGANPENGPKPVRPSESNSANGPRIVPPSGAITGSGSRRAILDGETLKTHIAGMLKASDDIIAFLLTSYRNDKGIHAETVIGAAAALAGEYALKATAKARNVPLPAKGWVVGSEVDDLLSMAPNPGCTSMLAVIVDAAKDAGMPASAAPDPIPIITRTVEALGSSPYPPLTIDRKHFPLEWSPNACVLHRGAIERIARTRAIDELGIAGALAFATGQLIKMTSKVIEPAIATRLAAEIMIGVSRMAPLQEAY